MIGRLALALLMLGCTEHIELGLDGAGTDRDSAISEDAGRGDSVDGGGANELCRVAGEPCVASGDCCNHICTDGFCVPSGSCGVAGESCGAAANCCSGACARDASGRVVCQLLGGCLPAGEICRTDGECCDAAEGPGACVVFDAMTGVGRCRTPTRCAHSGELCDAGRLTCCPGGMAGAGLCQPSEIAGINRCIGDEARAACLPAGARCSSPSECCSDTCTPVLETGTFSCSECAMEGQPCTRHADCCSANCREEGACFPTRAACTPFGARCTTSVECCSGLCAPDTGTCSSPLV